MFLAEHAEVAEKKISLTGKGSKMLFYIVNSNNFCVLCVLAPSPELWSVGDCAKVFNNS